jgi:hypothetical protein
VTFTTDIFFLRFTFFVRIHRLYVTPDVVAISPAFVFLCFAVLLQCLRRNTLV